MASRTRRRIEPAKNFFKRPQPIRSRSNSLKTRRWRSGSYPVGVMASKPQVIKMYFYPRVAVYSVAS